MPRTAAVSVDDTDSRPQVIDRVSRIFAVLARQGSDGARLVDLAREASIPRPTAHRLLQDLMSVGYVRQVEQRRYALGSALFSLGMSAPNPIRSIRGIHQAAQALSDQSGDTVYVSIRHFNGVHYIVRTDGRFPIRTYAANVGETVPFLNTYSGIVLLAAMGAKAEARELSRWERDRNEMWGAQDPEAHLAQLKGALHQARTEGYVYGANFYVPTIAGVAIPVPPRSGPPYVAVSISAVESRLPLERVASLRAQMEVTARRIASFAD